MLLEFLKYATRLLKNNMTTIILATTTATATTPTLNITTNFTTATTTTISNIISSALPTHNGMLPEQPATTQPPLEIFNSTLKTLFNKTLANVAQANLSDYTTPSPLTNGTGVVSGVEVGGTLAGGAATVMSALPTLPVSRYAMEATTSLPAQTVATFMAAGNKNRATIIVYPTVSPESIVIPIVSCIFGFPILALLVICCLRRRAKLARERDRRRNYDMQDHAVSLVRFSPIHRLSTSDMSEFICSAGCQRQTCQTSPTITSTTSASNCRLLADDSRLLPTLTVSLIACGVDNYRPSRAISLRPERSLSQGFTSLELDTVVEERSDVEQTQTEILNAESPMETTSSYRMSFSS